MPNKVEIGSLVAEFSKVIPGKAVLFAASVYGSHLFDIILHLKDDELGDIYLRTNGLEQRLRDESFAQILREKLSGIAKNKFAEAMI